MWYIHVDVVVQIDAKSYKDSLVKFVPKPWTTHMMLIISSGVFNFWFYIVAKFVPKPWTNTCMVLIISLDMFNFLFCIIVKFVPKPLDICLCDFNHIFGRVQLVILDFITYTYMRCGTSIFSHALNAIHWNLYLPCHGIKSIIYVIHIRLFFIKTYRY